jgi:hypothetical protein
MSCRPGFGYCGRLIFLRFPLTLWGLSVRYLHYLIENVNVEDSDDKETLFKKHASALALGMNLSAGMALFSVGGYYLDTPSDDGQYPWTLTGMFFGLAYSAYEVWKVVRRLNKRDRSNGNGQT